MVSGMQSAKTQHEKCNSKMEQHQSCSENHLWSHHWYHSWTCNSKSDSNRYSWGPFCWRIKGYRSTSGILPCNERSCTHGRRTENKHGLHCYALHGR